MPPIRFPKPNEIPPHAALDAAALSQRWLIDGEIRTWKGAAYDVVSPICFDRGGGKLERAVIGQLPKLGAAEGLAALAAARRAWDCGNGAWPRMRVSQRIGAVEKFVALML